MVHAPFTALWVRYWWCLEGRGALLDLLVLATLALFGACFGGYVRAIGRLR